MKKNRSKYNKYLEDTYQDYENDVPYKNNFYHPEVSEELDQSNVNINIKSLQKLTPREKIIILSKVTHGKDLVFRDIAPLMNLSFQRVQQIYEDKIKELGAVNEV